MAKHCKADRYLVISSMVNGHSNGVSLGSGGLGLDGLRSPCPTVYAAAVISEVFGAVFGSIISYGHVDKTHGVKIIVVNCSNDNIDNDGPRIEEEGDRRGSQFSTWWIMPPPVGRR